MGEMGDMGESKAQTDYKIVNKVLCFLFYFIS